jgi:hypothetical protein
MISGLIPGIAMLLGAIILVMYPLRGAYLEKVQATVLDLHVEKHARLNEAS